MRISPSMDVMGMKMQPTTDRPVFCGKTRPTGSDHIKFSGANAVQRQIDYMARLMNENCGAGITVGDVYAEILEQYEVVFEHQRNKAERMRQYRKQKASAIEEHQKKPFYIRWFSSPDYPPYPYPAYPSPNMRSEPQVTFGDVYGQYASTPRTRGNLGIEGGFAKTREMEAVQKAIKRLTESGLIRMATLVYSNYPKELFVNDSPIPHYSGTGLLSPIGLTVLDDKVAGELVRKGHAVFQFMLDLRNNREFIDEEF